MADIRVARPEGSGFVAAAGSARGDLFTADWIQRMVLEGRGFMVNVGAFSTPIQGGGAGTVPDLDQPEFTIEVPTGTTILPFRVAFNIATPLMAADADTSEILLAVDRVATGGTTGGTATSETCLNMRTDNPRASGCTAKSAFTGDITTAPTLGIELIHKFMKGDVQGTAATALWGGNDLLYEPKVPPLIVGPAILIGYWGGTVAHLGFATIQWVEIPTTYVTAHG